MKVFLSWSGARSEQVARFLSDWLKCVIQALEPWVSTRDIDQGSLWFGEISDQLKDATVGVICLTQENRERPWILFEAGALAKGLTSSRVCTLLIDLESKDIKDPLAQFNHTMPDRKGIMGLVRTLNDTLGERRLSPATLDQVFETYWPQFENKFSEIMKQTESASEAEPRPKEDLLVEILEATRSMNSRIRRIEADLDSGDVKQASGGDGGSAYFRAVEALVMGKSLRSILSTEAGLTPQMARNLHLLSDKMRLRKMGLSGGE